MPTIIKSVNFLTRVDLDRYIAAEFGIDMDKNKSLDIFIEGQKEDLKRLNLDDTCKVYGISVKITDKTTASEIKEKLERKNKTWKV